MNGPSHYREAERLLADVADMDPGYQQINAPRVLAEAQVHALLALAAATAAESVNRWLGDESRADAEWVGATS